MLRSYELRKNTTDNKQSNKWKGDKLGVEVLIFALFVWIHMDAWYK